jgi:DNA-binding GntR family transcriptional regulator
MAETRDLEGTLVTATGSNRLIAAVIGELEPSQTMGRSVARHLRELIISGELPARTPLQLAPLAESLHVSVMPIREALRLLESEGLVVVRPRRGAVVSTPSAEEAEEMYAVRVALEALAARHAAERLTEADIASLRDCYAAMAGARATGDLRAFVMRDHEFHLRLYRTSGRERLVKSIEELFSRSLRYVPYLHRAREMHGEDPLEAHLPLLSAIELRDPELIESLTRTHEQRAIDRLLAAIQHPTEVHSDRAPRGGHLNAGGDLGTDAAGRAPADTHDAGH